MGTDPPPLERAAGAIESDDDSKELNEKTKPIKVVLSSLEGSEKMIAKMNEKRSFAQSAVQDSQDKVGAATRHAADVAQECEQQKFVYGELIERLDDRGKSVHVLWGNLGVS